MKTSYSVVIHNLKTSPVLIKIMDKITLDDHSGRMAKDFKSRRAFFNQGSMSPIRLGLASLLSVWLQDSQV